MKTINLNRSVSESAEHLKKSLTDKGFTLFCDVDHQANAKTVDLEMRASRVLIFGNPMAGTKLMQKDIAMSLDLPLRIAVVDMEGQTVLLHQTTEDYCQHYQVENHPVLEKIAALYETLITELSE